MREPVRALVAVAGLPGEPAMTAEEKDGMFQLAYVAVAVMHVHVQSCSALRCCADAAGWHAAAILCVVHTICRLHAVT